MSSLVPGRGVAHPHGDRDPSAAPRSVAAARLTQDMTLCSEAGGSTPFRLAEKHFKNRSSRFVKPSLRTPYPVIDLSRPPRVGDDPVWQAGWWSPPPPASELGRRSRKGKEVDRGERPDLVEPRSITLSNGRKGYLLAEGCILLPGYLSEAEQLHYLQASLASYTLPPNPLSLTTHYSLPPDLFAMYAASSEELIPPKYVSLDSSIQAEIRDKPHTVRQLIDTEPASVLGYEEIVERNKTWTGDLPSDKLKAKTAEKLFKELRWANLGWVYQWSTKSYDFSEAEPIRFPDELGDLCVDVVRNIAWSEVFDGIPGVDHQSWAEDYRPDTGIVNFYQINDTLMAHVDRAELDPSRALVSVSLGHSAIFLLGGASRDIPPQPIVLRSGDVLIMSGSGRQSYHGVPRILEGTLPSHFASLGHDTREMAAAKRFISTARININARQVFPPGFERPK